jgi:hypothetical protein
MAQPGHKTHELLPVLRDILIADTEIAAFCQENYAKDQTVFCGVNLEELPDPETHYPVIVIFYADRKKTGNTGTITYSVEVGCGVYDNDIVEVTATSKTYSGIIRAAELRELTEKAIAKKSATLGKIDTTGDTYSDSIFPIFASNTIIEISWPKNYSRPVR